MTSDANGNAEAGRNVHSDIDAGDRLWDKWVDLLIAIIVWGGMAFLSLKVIPSFAAVYSQFGDKLPKLTRLVMQFGGAAGHITTLATAAGLVIFQFWRIRIIPKSSSTNAVRSWDKRIMLVIILIGTVLSFLVVIGLWLPMGPIGAPINSR